MQNLQKKNNIAGCSFLLEHLSNVIEKRLNDKITLFLPITIRKISLLRIVMCVENSKKRFPP